jgi:hypothetical protein
MVYRLIPLFLLFLSGLHGLHAATYYVRSGAPEGGDGLSDTTAFNDLNDVSTLALQPGDNVYFKRGSSWTGRLFINARSGTAQNQILISAYGDPAEPAPFINGVGGGEAVHLKNTNHLIFEHFRISNYRVDAAGEAVEPNAAGEGIEFASNNQRYGVKLEANAGGDIVGLVFRNNVINHVYGKMDKGAGIQGGGAGLVIRGAGSGVVGTPERKEGRFTSLIIEDNHIHDCVRNGIWGVYDYASDNHPSDPTKDVPFHHYHQGVEIRRNLIERVPGDGMIIWGCEGAIVEFNMLRDFTNLTHYSGNAAIALWTIKSKDCIIQHNQVTDHKAEHDGQAFDADFDSKGTTFQYNFSADNLGGFALVIGGTSHMRFLDPSTRDITFRYNLSFNDGFRVESGVAKFANFGPAFHFTGDIQNTWIYNNTFYLEKKPLSVDKELFYFETWPNGTATDIFVRNNVFFGTEDMGVDPTNSVNLALNSNLYYRISAPSVESNYIAGTISSANDYDLLLTDPLQRSQIGAPVPADDPQEDFFGNAVLPNGLGAYAGEALDWVEMSDRLVETVATLEIQQAITNVTIEVINLLDETLDIYQPGDLPAGSQYLFDMSGEPQGVYYFLVYAAEFGLEPVAKKFVKIDPFEGGPGEPLRFDSIECEAYLTASGVQIEGTAANARVASFDPNDWFMIPGVDFGSGADGIEVLLATARNGASFEIRLGAPTGTTLGTVSINSTGGWATANEATFYAPLTPTSGVHDLYFYGITAGNPGQNNIGKLNRFNLTLSNPMLNTPPTVSITGPGSASTFTAGDTISFSATADDAQDGSLTGAWSSDIDGALGTGNSLSLNTLSIGTHTITFAASDAEGETAADSIVVTVEPAPIIFPTLECEDYTDAFGVQAEGGGAQSARRQVRPERLVHDSQR